ncbi:hypothetical protein H2198_000459 [Neophaeococcomyces mojaviensis]|uniref:Uncharacterized protein n=1 Tax=Neophaeococcomyces mojaviensis TaxID=3383035 RepID=A0ACC3AK36_9EURO|nr:hypothetical protein H2198_000459 [Knufia sp. JES_112]
MSSRFVAAGGTDVEPPPENDDWAKARKQVDDSKKLKVDASGTQEGGKSLYEHLQAQKVAKQEAFEEAARVRNQFRPLDDSEVEFLESVEQSQRAQAATVRKETAEQLDVFRKERAAAEQLAREDALKQAEQPAQTKNDQDTWATTKKRRRAHGDDNKDEVMKLRRISATGNGPKRLVEQIDAARISPKKSPTETSKAVVSDVKPVPAPEKATSTAKPASTLVDYGSDSDS